MRTLMHPICMLSHGPIMPRYAAHLLPCILHFPVLDSNVGMIFIVNLSVDSSLELIVGWVVSIQHD